MYNNLIFFYKIEFEKLYAYNPLDLIVYFSLNQFDFHRYFKVNTQKEIQVLCLTKTNYGLNT